MLLSRLDGTEWEVPADVLIEEMARRHAQTAAHSLRVAEVLLRMRAGAPARFPSAVTVLLAGLLHDAGKIFVPARILDAARPLTPAELSAVRAHPERGAALLAGLGLPAAVVAAARDHHEHFRGGGYPSGLPTARRSFLVRAVAVADGFVAMIEPGRGYRTPLSRERAVAEVTRCAGTQFCPEAAALLRAVLGTVPSLEG